MGRLFWKFFLSYWAALLVGVLGAETAAWLYRLADQEPAPPLEAGPRAAVIVGAAAATLRHGGLPALRELLGHEQKNGDGSVFVVDRAGRDVLGRPVPSQALNHALRLLAAQDDAEEARRVRRADGDTYLVFIPATTSSAPNRLPFRRGPPSPLVPLATGTLASLVFGALLAWYVARPVRHLREAFASLARGQLETRVGDRIGRRRDEVADLGRDFDRMAQQLQSLMAAQCSLLHDVSHELRSPLARLQAAIGLARQDRERHQSSLARIEREAERLEELVQQVLTLSRLEARVGTASLEPVEATDLMDLVASIAADAHFEARAADKSVTFSGDGKAVAAVRAELLHRAIENVVRNAVKYTQVGTTVAVTAGRSPAGDAFRVRVVDHGPGVADTELEAIFEPFYRSLVDQPDTGFGLGLAIARRAVESHGGRVRAENRQGGGLRVEIDVPLASEVSPS
jgi:two-component system, OmpR family, sensor kinase